MPELALRFGIHDDHGNQAATWKLWTQTGNSDVYLTCRTLGGTLKTSFHESGQWHVAYTQNKFETIVKGAILNKSDSYIQKWPRPKPIAAGITLAYRIVTPYFAITLPKPKTHKKFTWITNAPQPKSTEIDILITSPFQKVTGWPGKRSMGNSLIGSFDLTNGGRIWAVYMIVDMPDLSTINNKPAQFYKGRSKEDLKSGILRALAFGDEKDGSRVIYDVLVQ